MPLLMHDLNKIAGIMHVGRMADVDAEFHFFFFDIGFDTPLYPLSRGELVAPMKGLQVLTHYQDEKKLKKRKIYSLCIMLTKFD
ncbi:MAG: hypothetical protein GVY19_13080 [Bacteroidetes bacterium]|jgi:hypothetical protein|nr:hypothetical protein [Bacteroidota bacterium]